MASSPRTAYWALMRRLFIESLVRTAPLAASALSAMGGQGFSAWRADDKRALWKSVLRCGAYALRAHGTPQRCVYANFRRLQSVRIVQRPAEKAPFVAATANGA